MRPAPPSVVELSANSSSRAAQSCPWVINNVPCYLRGFLSRKDALCGILPVDSAIRAKQVLGGQAGRGAARRSRGNERPNGQGRVEQSQGRGNDHQVNQILDLSSRAADPPAAGRAALGVKWGAAVTGARRVLLADDHLGARTGTRIALEAGGFVVCAEAADGPSAVEAARRERPDVCLLDVLMPGGGIEAAARIAAELPDTAIVMFTVSDDEDNLFDAIRAGAVGYLLKDMDPDRLPHALSGVLAGEAAFPRRLMIRVIEEFSERQRRRVPLPAGGRAELTGREWETLQLLRAGDTTSAAARRLGISQVTVRRHVSEAVRKLRVPDREAAFKLLELVHANLPSRRPER